MVVQQEATQDHDTLIARVEANRVAKEAARVERRRALIIGFTDGAITDPDEISEALEACGMTPAELTAEAKRIIRRRELLATIHKCAANDARRIEIAEEQRAENERFAPLQKEHKSKHFALGNELARINDEVVQSSAAADEMRRTAPEHLRTERASLTKRQGATAQNLYDLQREQLRLTEAVAGFRGAMRDSRTTEFRRNEHSGNLAEALRVLAKVDEQIAGVNAVLAGISARNIEIEELMLQP